MSHNIDQSYSEELKPGHFRLLQLARPDTAGNDDQPVCQVSVHAFEKCPPYIALSYAWHEPLAFTENGSGDHAQVVLDGRIVQATPNLVYALRHLSSQHGEEDGGYLWVDALCIDQSSDAERTSQVSMMHQIYHKATAVHVWLGPDLQQEAYTVREVFRALLQKYSHEEDGVGCVTARKYENEFLHRNDEQDLIDAGLPPMESDIWEQVVKFWDRAWFSRVWVQQEVAVAQRVSLWCGDVEFTQEELVETSRFFIFSGLCGSMMLVRMRLQGISSNTFSGRRVGGSAIRISNLQSWASGNSLSEGVDAKQSADRMTGPPVLDSEGNIANPLVRHLGIQLHLTFRDDSSDPRDRIFALLVLLKQGAEANGLEELPLRAEYSKSVATVFTETTVWIIENTGWLGLLSLIHPRRSLDSVYGMPSWVPDLCSDPPNPLLLFEDVLDARIEEHFAMVTAYTRPSFQSQQLRVSVKRIGLVQDIGNSYTDHMEHGMFEATAKLLLNVPDEVWPNYTRIDYWTDVMDCQIFPSYHPNPDGDRRSDLRHWLIFALLRKINQEFRAGRLARGRDHLVKMPSLEALAQADTSRTIPTLNDWITEFNMHAENQLKILNQRPRFRFDETPGRRLFRMADLGFPHCPSATMLGLGPETVMPGDEVFQAVGSVMPLVLRRTAASVDRAIPQARVVGEAFITGFNYILSRIDDQPYERWGLL